MPESCVSLRLGVSLLGYRLLVEVTEVTVGAMMNGRQVLERWLGDLDGGVRRCWVMGVLNVTPDSFSDGGSFLDPGMAVEAAMKMAAGGADVIDIGAESTRPGSLPVSEGEQLARLLPVLQGLDRAGFGLPVTVDTTRARVVEECLAWGVAGVNDVSAGLQDPAMLGVVARAGVAYIAMHMRGDPLTMQEDPRYPVLGVVGEVAEFLEGRLDAAVSAGVRREMLLADPGIGFGKTLLHNVRLLRDLPWLAGKLGVPVLVGTSRKGFLGKITGRADARDRLMATAGSVAWAAGNGAAMVRVHDVGEMRDVVEVVYAIRAAGESAPDA